MYKRQIEDWLHNAPAGLPMHQIWHLGEGLFEKDTLKAFDEKNLEITPTETEGWYSEKYGEKVAVPRLVFSTPGRYLKTEISLLATACSECCLLYTSRCV